MSQIYFFTLRLCFFLPPLFFIFSCSKDSEEETGNQMLQQCEIDNLDEGCAAVFLEGNTNWVKILKQGDVADPLFLYPSADKNEPYGTVTITLENGLPVLKFNDVILDDYLIYTSQTSDGKNSFCKADKDVETVASGNNSTTTIRLTNKYEFPFYIQLEANVCF